MNQLRAVISYQVNILNVKPKKQCRFYSWIQAYTTSFANCGCIPINVSRLVILTDNLYRLLGHFRVGLQEFPLIVTPETRPPLFWGAIPKMALFLRAWMLKQCPLYWITNVDSVLECTYLSIPMFKMEEVLWNVMWYDWYTHTHTQAI